MIETPSLAWQASLFGSEEPAADPSFRGLVRHQLDETAWVDHVPGWLRGADELFGELARSVPWAVQSIVIHGRRLPQPRLTAHWSDINAAPSVLPDLARLLTARYHRRFDSIGANLYRDGRDSVAWHGDRIPREVQDPLVAIVSLGAARRFQLRPREGRLALTLVPGPGDLVVMGGSSQRTWQHTVPKLASAGPRISVTFRHSSNEELVPGG